MFIHFLGFHKKQNNINDNKSKVKKNMYVNKENNVR